MIRSYSPLDERLRHAMLMEYLTVRRLREDARKTIKRADEADAYEAESDRIRAESDPYFHPYRSPATSAGRYHRQSAERTRAQADGATDVVRRMRDVLRGGY